MDKQDTATTLYSSFKSEKEYLEMLEAAIDLSEIGYLITDGECNVIKINPAQIRITGQAPEVNLGRNMRDVEKSDKSPSASVKVKKSGAPVKLEQHIVNGKSYLVYGIPYFGKDGKLKYIINNLIDSTEINRTKEKLKNIQSANEKLNDKVKELKNQIQIESKIIYRSDAMHNMLLLCQKAAQYDAAVLILGESGAGKELVSEYIFERSRRSGGTFLKINCASIPENLLESELFGYEAGSFTGANNKGKKGLLEYADKGTLLLDEIGELPIKLQAKLLRFLQEGEFYRVGGRNPVYADVRILAATNRNLQEMIENKTFREDLYYRLNVIQIRVPSLRERKEDIPLLIRHFTKQFNEKYGCKKTFSIDAVEFFQHISMKGNVRGLRNSVQRLLMLCENDIINAVDVEMILSDEEKIIMPQNNTGLKEILENCEEKILRQYAAVYKTEQALSRILKISQSTVSRKLSKYGIRNIQK
ncbi:sigma 54-interacting transcriptional regulator [Anaerotignum faecicola]|nr:sigma 54-interacting transcriptional regulator [Anaerotignum faecicola]